jgi:hypothetical protein
MDFPDFEQLTRQFTTEAVDLAKTLSSQQRPRPTKRRPDRPSARPPIDRRRPLPGDPTAAKRLQHLYRISKKRAARQVFGDESLSFDGTIDDATAFFTESFGPRNCDTTKLLEELAAFVPSAPMDNDLFTPHLQMNSPPNFALWQTLLLAKTALSTAIYVSWTHAAKSFLRCFAIVSLQKTSLLPGKQPPQS